MFVFEPQTSRTLSLRVLHSLVRKTVEYQSTRFHIATFWNSHRSLATVKTITCQTCSVYHFPSGVTAKLEVHNCGPDPHRSGSIPRPCSFSVVWKVGTERSFRVSCHWTAGAPGCRFILVRRRKKLIMLFNWSQQGTRLIHLFPLWLEAR